MEGTEPQHPIVEAHNAAILACHTWGHVEEGLILLLLSNIFGREGAEGRGSGAPGGPVPHRGGLPRRTDGHEPLLGELAPC